MRKIKFRGKVLHHKSHQKSDWVYGMPTIFRDGRTAIRWQCSENAKDPNAWKSQSVVQETLSQFTGVYDCNGKEVYEGDIVRCRGNYHFEVIWSNVRFLLKGIDYHGYAELMGFLRNEIEIIGNIHDNPELLKGGSYDKE